MRLVFLGRLEDLAGAAERAVAPGPLGAVLAGLEPALAGALAATSVRLALNGTLVDRAGLLLAAGDELAFLPPVSGG